MEPKTAEEAITAAKSVWSKFKGGAYREAIAGCIMLLIFLWRRFAAKFIIGKLSPWWVGFVTILVAYIATIPEALAATKFGWGSFLWSGLLTSAESMLLWSMLGKRILPKLFKKEESTEDE